jgi:hypothetical protein
METKLVEGSNEEVVELTFEVLAQIGGGINPQPLPPEHE